MFTWLFRCVATISVVDNFWLTGLPFCWEKIFYTISPSALSCIWCFPFSHSVHTPVITFHLMFCLFCLQNLRCQSFVFEKTNKTSRNEIIRQFRIFSGVGSLPNYGIIFEARPAPNQNHMIFLKHQWFYHLIWLSWKLVQHTNPGYYIFFMLAQLI